MNPSYFWWCLPVLHCANAFSFGPEHTAFTLGIGPLSGYSAPINISWNALAQVWDSQMLRIALFLLGIQFPVIVETQWFQRETKTSNIFPPSYLPHHVSFKWVHINTVFELLVELQKEKLNEFWLEIRTEFSNVLSDPKYSLLFYSTYLCKVVFSALTIINFLKIGDWVSCSPG